MGSLEFLAQLQEEHDRRKKILLSYAAPVFDRTFEDALEEALALDPIVIAPYTHNYPEHIAALQHIGYAYVRVPCTRETAYYELLVAAYKTGKPVVVIEHDMVPRPTDVAELLKCSHYWCGFTYYHRYKRVKACLGLTKLAMYDSLPDIFDKVTNDWRYIDGELEAHLTLAHRTIHEHRPLAVHLNPLIEVPGPEATPELEDRLMLTALFIAKNPDWRDPTNSMTSTNKACTLEHPCGVCYGCGLRAKSLNIQGATVAGHGFGTPYYPVLVDRAEDQGVVAGEAWIDISKKMRAGGPVAEDALQQPMEIQRARANAAAQEVGKHLPKNKLPKPMPERAVKPAVK